MCICSSELSYVGLFEGLVGKFCFLPILFNDLFSFLAIFIIHTETSDGHACKSCSDCAMLYAFLEVLSSCQCWDVKWLWSSGCPKSSKTSTVYTVYSTEIIGERWWMTMDPIAGNKNIIGQRFIQDQWQGLAYTTGSGETQRITWQRLI